MPTAHRTSESTWEVSDDTGPAVAQAFAGPDGRHLVTFPVAPYAVWADLADAIGWKASRADMAAMLNDAELDPECYLVARNRHSDDYDGIIRVWMATPMPKIGFVAVVESQRRCRLAAMMIEAAAGRLRDRGVGHVSARTDVDNRAAHTMAL